MRPTRDGADTVVRRNTGRHSEHSVIATCVPPNFLGRQFNETVACHQLMASRARSFDIVGDYRLHAGPCRVPSVAFMASAPKGNRAGPMGNGVYNRLRRDDTYHRPPEHDTRLLVDHCRQCTSGYRLWGPVERRAKVRRQKRLDPLGIGRGRVLARCLLD